MGKVDVARAEAAEADLKKVIKEWGGLLGQISEILAASDDLPCAPDEFSWGDIPELLSEMTGFEKGGENE